MQEKPWDFKKFQITLQKRPQSFAFRCTIFIYTVMVSLSLQFCSLPLEAVIFKSSLFKGIGMPQAKYIYRKITFLQTKKQQVIQHQNDFISYLESIAQFNTIAALYFQQLNGSASQKCLVSAQPDDRRPLNCDNKKYLNNGLDS